MKRPAFDATEDALRRPRDQGAADLPLWSDVPERPMWAQRWASITDEERAAQTARWKELLRPRVVAMASRRGPEGITASEVIGDGITSGILWGEATFLAAHPRVYSFVGGWLSQLAKDGTLRPKLHHLGNGQSIHAMRTSERQLSHRNQGRVYLLGERAA